MSKLLDKKSNTLGSIAAIQTLLERYPVLTTTDSMLTNFSVNTSVGFLLDILSVLGITQVDLIKWVSKLLSGNQVGDGILNVIEQAIKVILLTNVKEMWTCSINPILPDSIMRYSNPIFTDGTRKDPYEDASILKSKDYKRIEIDLNQVDMFGILNNCPSDSDGSIFYFDSYESIFDTKEKTDKSNLDNFKGSFKNFEEVEKRKEEDKNFKLNDGDIIKITKGFDKYYILKDDSFVLYEDSPSYSPNDLWKSCDFNAYLWYIINKGTTSNLSDLQYSCWDNRVQNLSQLRDNPSLRSEFFNIKKCQETESAELDKIEITSGDETINKKQIIICEFNERVTPTANEGSLPSSNVLRVWLNANRYYRTRKVKAKKPSAKNDDEYIELAFNKTIFEFNFDYIYSLKLFDTKSLVAQILNSLLGLSASLSVSFSVEQKMIEAKVGEMVKKVIEMDDQSSSDCYYTFSNEEYDKMLKETLDKYSGVYSSGNETGSMVNVDSQDIINSLKNIKQSDSIVEQQTKLTRILEEITETVSSPSSITQDCKFSFGLNFILDFIQQTVTQITLQVLSPKVAILYSINSAIMGGDADNIKSWEDFMKNFQNVLISIIKKVKDIIVEELLKFVMEQIQPLLELLISKLVLETLQYYKELIEQLIVDCIPTIPMINFGTSNTTIDNVNYADITVEDNPNNENNKC